MNLTVALKEDSWLRIANLAAELPKEARSWRELFPEYEWSTDTYLLHAIEYLCRVLVWMQTKDAQKGANRPKPTPTPKEIREQTRKIENTDFDAIDRAFGQQIHRER